MVHDTLRKIYNTTPKCWLQEIFRRLRSGESDVESREPGVAWLLDEAYFARRDPLVQGLVERIRLGERLEEVLIGIPARDFDERAVEYPALVDWLLRQPTGLDLLDIGCVLNNKLVSNVLNERCRQIWFSNVALEPKLYVRNPVYYHVAALADAFPVGAQFPLVTCLSTIEHIGFDNSQYGCVAPALYREPVVEPLVASLRKLATLTAPEGGLLVSVPFGLPEALRHPRTGKLASQVFDHRALERGMEALADEGVSATYRVFAIAPDRWVPVDPAGCRLRYADGCPSAAAVALLEGRKQG